MVWPGEDALSSVSTVETARTRVPEVLAHEKMDKLPACERVPSRGDRSLDVPTSGVEEAESPVSVSLGMHVSKIGTCRKQQQGGSSGGVAAGGKGMTGRGDNAQAEGQEKRVVGGGRCHGRIVYKALQQQQERELDR